MSRSTCLIIQNESIIKLFIYACAALVYIFKIILLSNLMKSAVFVESKFCIKRRYIYNDVDNIHCITFIDTYTYLLIWLEIQN